MMEVVLATRNAKKVQELRALLLGEPVSVLSLADFPEIPEVPETGDTFAENAKLKAEAVARATGRIALADDSGLEVDALGGRPGVYSSRFVEGSDKDRYMKILELLAGVPQEKRAARFKAAIAIAEPDGTTVVVEDSCEGIIATEPSGDGGFGYDPIFYLQELGRTMAQLSPEEKNHISHRGKALREAVEILKDRRP
ncbi:MAG: XTP/dITP diphosphatase [Armatimonadota bacterium]